MLGLYHGYYRLSKFCFKRDFLMKFTQSQALISEYHSRVLAMTCCSIITLVACFYHVPNIAPHFFNMETIFNLKLQYYHFGCLFLPCSEYCSALFQYGNDFQFEASVLSLWLLVFTMFRILLRTFSIWKRFSI